MVPATDLEFAEVQAEPALAVQLPSHSAIDPTSIGLAMHAAFETVMSFAGRHGLAINGHPRVIYTAYDASGVSFTVALPVAEPPQGPIAQPPIVVDVLAPAKAYRFTHHGPYSELMHTYGRITAFLKDRGTLKSDADWARHMPMWEEYVNDPEKTAPSELVTHIYVPV